MNVATATDRELLACYARDHADAAFAELVRRHVDLAYSTALRLVRSPQTAEDITQSAFVDLAHSAARLQPDTILAAWLHQVVWRTGVDVIRRETRRRLREEIATEMNAINSPDACWSQVEPLLDEALSALDTPDRAAVLLRYFENKPLREVGAALGVSDDAAQKRVSRAVERLREYFGKHGVTVGAGGLTLAISANAVSAAPVTLAATITTAAIAGTAATVTVAAATTKAIAMTTLRKAVITATLAALAGAGLYEIRQATQLRSKVQNLQQQQAPLMAQVQELQARLAAATNRLADLLKENSRLSDNPEHAELLKLRGEVTRLQNNARVATLATAETAVTLGATAQSWLARVEQLKQFVQEHPEQTIPEFQFLDNRAWLAVADAGLKTEMFETESDYDHAMQSLRFQAEGNFGHKVTAALREYQSANNNAFPNNLSQLSPYSSPEVMETLQSLYEIKPASFIPEDERKKISANFDKFITRKKRVTQNTTSRLAIFADGYAYWQSSP